MLALDDIAAMPVASTRFSTLILFLAHGRHASHEYRARLSRSFPSLEAQHAEFYMPWHACAASTPAQSCHALESPA